MDKKLIVFLTAAAAVATLLGVSLFGGKSVPEATDVVLKTIGIKTAEVTNPPNVTSSPIVIIMTPTSEPTPPSNPDNSITPTEQPTNNVTVIVPTTIPDDGIKGQPKSLNFITTTQNPDPKKEENRKDNADNNNSGNSNSEDNDSENNDSENNDSEINTDISATEKPVLANNETNQTINTKLKIPSKGYLMLKSKSFRRQTKTEESTIGISKVTDENGNTIENSEFSSFKYSEIVNEENLEQENEKIYVPVSIGIYIFTFTNCETEDLEVLFTEYTSTDENTEHENDNTENENLLVPSQGIWQFNVTQNQPEMSCNFKAEKSFTPLIQFYSDEVDEEEIYIHILDTYGNNLQSIKLNQKNESDAYEIMGDFTFTENEEYQLEVHSDIQIENVQCFLSFSETSE